jgi:hypothetical protein
MGHSNNSINPLINMFQILKPPFPNIKFNYTSTDDIEKKIMKSLKTRHSLGYIEICVKILKLSAPFCQFSSNIHM